MPRGLDALDGRTSSLGGEQNEAYDRCTCCRSSHRPLAEGPRKRPEGQQQCRRNSEQAGEAPAPTKNARGVELLNIQRYRGHEGDFLNGLVHRLQHFLAQAHAAQKLPDAPGAGQRLAQHEGNPKKRLHANKGGVHRTLEDQCQHAHVCRQPGRHYEICLAQRRRGNKLPNGEAHVPDLRTGDLRGGHAPPGLALRGDREQRQA
mmetsp:Transcript_165782/g.532352  ORF Transcript_165782/g.532352 Transcript_165782/m.532352 type:complete len:204 (+) Transcript_165782:477-1088(+)